MKKRAPLICAVLWCLTLIIITLIFSLNKSNEAQAQSCNLYNVRACQAGSCPISPTCGGWGTLINQVNSSGNGGGYNLGLCYQ